METVKTEIVNGKKTTFVKYTEEELEQIKEHAKQKKENPGWGWNKPAPEKAN